MYEKKRAVSYRYNDAADADLDRILAPDHTALLLIDMQNDFCSQEGKFAKAGRDASDIIKIIPKCRELLDAARAAGVMVVHIQQSTLPGEQSDTGGWLAFKTRDGKAPTYATVNTWGWEHIEELRPHNDREDGRFFEPVITKFRPDGFLNTNLDAILRSNGIASVVCCGCTTEGCVLATVMGAAFHDYYTCVAEDAVATSVEGAHEHAIWLMKKRYLVRSTARIAAAWNSEQNTEKNEETGKEGKDVKDAK